MALLLIKHRPGLTSRAASATLCRGRQPFVSVCSASAAAVAGATAAAFATSAAAITGEASARLLRAGKTCEGSTTAPERKGVAKVRLRKGPMGEPHKAVRRLDLAVLPEAIQQALLRPPEAESSDEEGPSLMPVKTATRATRGLVSAEAQQQHPSGS